MDNELLEVQPLLYEAADIAELTQVTITSLRQ